MSDAGEVTWSNEVSRLNRIVVLLTLALTTGLLADSGDTPLIDAVKRGDHNAVRTQLRGKIDVNAPNVWLRDPVLYRIRHLRSDVLNQSSTARYV